MDHGRPILVFATTSAANHGEFPVEEHGGHFDPQHATRIRSRSDPPYFGQWRRRGSGAKRARRWCRLVQYQTCEEKIDLFNSFLELSGQSLRWIIGRKAAMDDG